MDVAGNFTCRIWRRVAACLSLPLTRKAAPPKIAVARPALELWAILGFLIVYAVGFLGWGMSATRAALPPGREQELLVLAVKLLMHVAAPALLLAALGAKIAPLFSSAGRRPGFWPPLLVLGAIILALLCVVSPALDEIKALHASVAYSGLGRAGGIHLAGHRGRSVRGIPVSRGAANPAGGRLENRSRRRRDRGRAVRVGSRAGPVSARAPGVDGYSTDPMQVMAFTIAVLSPVALLFGTLWARTRSLLLIVLLHAAVDVLPNLSDFVRTWAPP